MWTNAIRSLQFRENNGLASKEIAICPIALSSSMLVQRRIQMIHLPMNYLLGFASIHSKLIALNGSMH